MILERPTFTPDPSDPTACPSCHTGGTVQHVEKVEHYRSVSGIAPDGHLLIDGEFDWNGDGAEDEHLSCYACAAEWQLPRNVEYV